MDVQLTPDQEAFFAQTIQSGWLQRGEDAVQEAMSLPEERERRRLEILLAVDQADASIARGEGRRMTSQRNAAALVTDIKSVEWPVSQPSVSCDNGGVSPLSRTSTPSGSISLVNPASR